MDKLTLHGWIVIDKPVGIGSTPCVAAVKRALREGGHAKVKVGHGGTLDPLASGVLPVAIGEATKLAGRLLDGDKVYVFTIRLGAETDTLDAEGREVATSPVRPTRDKVEAVLPRFIGRIEQVPPAYSAIKVDGARAYDRARAGEALEMQKRAVTVHALTILPAAGAAAAGSSGEAAGAGDAPPSRYARSPSPSGPGEELEDVTLRAHVSKGTYIRSLARDVAAACGSVGHVVMLRRLRAGPFGLDTAISLDKLADLAKARALETITLPLTAGLDDIPALPVFPDQARALREGRRLIGIAARPGLNLAMHDDVPVALVEVIGPEVRVVRGFNL